LVAQRIVATIIHIACNIVQQQIATPQHIDLAVMQGFGYPTGPLALSDVLGATRILTVLRLSAPH
jgi:3-hydroxybutyryl-CoA dehydrogenase